MYALIELVDVAAENLDHLAPEHLVRPLAQPIQERPVGKAIALVAVDIGERHAQRVELVLGQRGQRLPLHRHAEGWR